MKNRGDSIIDQILKDAIKEEIKNSPPPKPSFEAWEQLNQHLQNERNTRLKKRPSKKFILVAASFLIIFFFSFVISTTQVSAFSKLTEIFHKISGSVVQLFGKAVEPQDDDSDAPSSDEFSIVEKSKLSSQQMKLQEAQKVTAFNIVVPKIVPSNFMLKYVTVLKRGDAKSQEIFIEYVDEQRNFNIREVTTQEQFGFGEIDDEDIELEEIAINGHKATLLSYKNGNKRLVWITTNYYFEIRGKITKEEIIQIAKSM